MSTVMDDAGAITVARPVHGLKRVPAGCVGLRVHPTESLERLNAGAALVGRKPLSDEVVWLAPMSSHQLMLALHPSARDVGLLLDVEVADAAGAVDAYRFEAYLATRMPETLTCGLLAADIQAWLQAALQQGTLDLPPCETPDEWRAFRLALGHALHARFGLGIGDCFLIDLFGAEPTSESARIVDMVAAETSPGTVDCTPPLLGLRSRRIGRSRAALSPASVEKRLFVELPRLARALRAPNLPQDDEPTVLRQLSMARRLDSVARRAALRLRTAATSPLTSPHTVQDLDDAWAIVDAFSRSVQASVANPSWQAILDDADRVIANLESTIGSGSTA